MDNKTIETIEIIVQANVKKAMNDIKRACKDAESQISSIQKTVNKVDTKNIQKTFEQSADEIKKNISDVKVSVHNLFNGLDTKEIEQVKDKFKDVIVESEEQISVLLGSLEDVENYVQEIFDNKKELEIDDSSIEEVKQNLQDIKGIQPSGGATSPTKSEATAPKIKLPDTEALKNVDATSFLNSWKTALGGVLAEIPKLSEVYDKAINNINTSGILDKFASVKDKVSTMFSNIKVAIDESKPVSAVKNISVKLGEVFAKIGNIKNSASVPFTYMRDKASEAFNNIKEKIKGLGDKFSNPINAVKKFTSGIAGAVKKLKDIKNSSSGIDSVTKAFKKGLSSIKLFVGGLISARGAYRVLSKASQAYLSFDTELQNSFNNSWNTLGSLLAPALEFVANLFAKLTSYVASFVQALTGVNLIAKANAKALKSQASATKEAGNASKSLGSIDEITNISSSSGGGSSSDTPQITTTDVDTSMFDGLIDTIDEIKKHLELLFEPIQKSWNKYGAGVIKSVKKAFNETIKLIEEMYLSFESVWTNGSGEAFMDNMFQKLTLIFDIIGNVAEAWSSAWSSNNAGTDFIQSIMDAIVNLQSFIIEVLASIDEVVANGTFATTVSYILSICTSIFDTIGNIAGAFTNAWTNANTGTGIIQNISNIFNTILGFGESIVDTIEKWTVSEEFQNALNFVFSYLEDITDIIEDIANWVLDMWNKYVKPVLDEKIMPLLGDLTDAVKAIWDVTKPIIEKIVEYVKSYVEPVIQGVMGAISGIIDVIRGVLKFITGVFTGDWKKAWEGVRTIFKGVWDTLGSVIKTPLNLILAGVENLVNAIISAFNSLKKMLNKISFNIPDWVPVIGGQKWGFDFKMSDKVSLPRLATGNVAKEPTVAMFGEYANARTNPEITSPVSTLKDAFRDVLSEFEFGNASGIEHLTLNVGANTLFDDFIDYINNKSSSLGVNVIKDVE